MCPFTFVRSWHMPAFHIAFKFIFMNLCGPIHYLLHRQADRLAASGPIRLLKRLSVGQISGMGCTFTHTIHTHLRSPYCLVHPYSPYMHVHWRRHHLSVVNYTHYTSILFGGFLEEYGSFIARNATSNKIYDRF